MANEIIASRPKQLCPVCSIPEDFDEPIISIFPDEEEFEFLKSINGKAIKVSSHPCKDCMNTLEDDEIILLEIKDDISNGLEITGRAYRLSKNVVEFFEKEKRSTILTLRLAYATQELVTAIKAEIKRRL